MIASQIAKHNAKDLLRFITCGNVDDGKSTLIGRLLLESGAIYDDQIDSLQSESAKHGTVGDRLDTALLLDGLEDERQQGITIDVAYRYFTTPNRKFIIADTPGHEQFTRNMATGASTADLAIILVDATKGVSTQTRRHAYIVSLLGIRQVIVAVNKMDLVDFDQSVYARISAEFGMFASDLSLQKVWTIPLSALDGDNVVKQSERMPWFTNPTLLEQLDLVPVDHNGTDEPFRFPVQWVNRPDANFRGFSGTVASGTVQVGDRVLILPSQKKSTIERILTMDGDLGGAETGDSVTLTLADEIDISRGDMIAAENQLPRVSKSSDANMLWMSETALVPGKQYWLKHTTKRTSCEVGNIRFSIDVDTLQKSAASSLALNAVGCCQLQLHDPIVFDAYSSNRTTGSFILVDRISHETVAAGMLLEPSSEPGTSGYWEQTPTTVRPSLAVSHVSTDDRANRLGHRPLTILITGLSGSGKTSVAVELESRLFEEGQHPVVLDGQSMRLGISRDLGFSAEERSENLRRASEIAKLINDSGQICIAAFVAPSDWVRQKARELIGPDRFFHVHLSTPVEVCRQRDTSGQYEAADTGEIASFPGVTFAYEQPTDADLTIDTGEVSIEAASSQIAAKAKRLMRLAV